ncbi:MAG: hypothetical protein CSB55_02305 [Candidatus Cloacimonadota bacterium]|nr:MAG: hypothetical protein CSB55_02305 [Candidatus Cloacimonadota bacterium]
MKKILLFAFLMIISFVYSVIPYPGNDCSGDYPVSSVSKIYSQKDERRELPRNVLAIMVEFQDVKFISEPQYPDFLAHDKRYFEKHLLNTVDYWFDASHGQYEFKYEVYDRITLDNDMLIYGANDDGSAVANMVKETVEKIDPDIDFNDYDAFIIFHAGAGQEASGFSGPEELIWSTFINREDLQEVFDPENDEYQGIETNDGKIVCEFAVLPETEWVPTFVPGEDPVLNIFGVLLHEYGHQLGLPTLFDNVSSNGRSHGIGQFGIMGEGAWVANGNVPPLPCAWSRYYLGWENPVVITEESFNNKLDYVLSSEETNPRMYKIPVSSREYFLLENRRQNPDNSFETWKYYINEDGDLGEIYRPSFTFELSEDQEYYEYPNEDKPIFDFYKNRYRGCEWDFYMPGIGTTADYTDNSGIFIWHIDENVIDEKFTDNFDENHVNGDAFHKGVDLEEADGRQNMDFYIGEFANGGPFDSYRAGNNSYFGGIQNPDTGEYSIPSAESYYGGITAEIIDIGEAGETMTFSVQYPWVLDPGDSFDHELDAKFSALVIKNEDKKEFFQIHSGGELLTWDYENHGVSFDEADSVVFNPAYDEKNGTVYIPTYSASGNVEAYCYQNGELGIFGISSYLDAESYCWASHPLINMKDSESEIIFLFNGKEGSNSLIYIFDESGEVKRVFEFDEKISCNPVLHDDILYVVTENEEAGFKLINIDIDSEEIGETVLPDISEDKSVISLVAGKISPVTPYGEPVAENDFQYVVTTAENDIFLYDGTGRLFDGFPGLIEPENSASPVLADVTGNGLLNIVYSGENGVAVYGYDGDLVNSPVQMLSAENEQGFSAGAIAVNFIENGLSEIIGNYSLGRLNIYSENVSEIPGMPITVPGISKCPPTPEKSGDTLFVYISALRGQVYRHFIPDCEFSLEESWTAEFGNPQRTAFGLITAPNKFESNTTYVPGQVYVYPNPYTKLSSLENAKLNIMITEKTEVSVKIYDIASNLLYQKKAVCEPYLSSREKFLIPVKDWTSGVYFIVIEADGETKKIKFAVEK